MYPIKMIDVRLLLVKPTLWLSLASVWMTPSHFSLSKNYVAAWVLKTHDTHTIAHRIVLTHCQSQSHTVPCINITTNTLLIAVLK